MQGTPIGSTNKGTKVHYSLSFLDQIACTRVIANKLKNTSDPESYENTKQEGSGAVASDSLAADSSRAGGAFSENRDSEPLSVEGGKSTLANTDISATTTFPPASDATARDETWNETGAGEKYPEGAGGQGEFPGSHAGGTYSGGPTSAKQNLGSGSKEDSYDTSGSGGAFSDSGSGGGNTDKISSSGGQSYTSASGSGGPSSNDDSGFGDSSGGGGGDGSNAGTAPGYVSSVTQPLGQGKPKGKNLTEGGFEGEANNNPEIGSEEDPGRKAEADMQKKMQSASGATGPRQGGQSGETPYDVLGDD